MKKSKVSQATLFQSWGHSAQSSSSRNPNLNGTETSTSRPQSSVYSATNPDDIVDLGDEDDDDELLAAAEGMAPDDTHVHSGMAFAGQANSSTHVFCNPDEVEVIPGFDIEAGNVWIYPTNYPIRNYQYDIVNQALFKNTLVTLPTGLGKTFIAAVVMYNFYRWYPQGKVVFMAPTKPLVAQQIEACFNIMGIPQSDTVEMTGNMAPNKRQSLWISRRVFFLTPQVLQNDLNRGSCKAEEVVLLVADEAHKALGNHAYCQVVREISGYTRNFRVLALSATPGDDLEAVQQVITNLLISHMELRSEESPDIKPYTHSRLVEKVVVSLGEDIAKIKTAYLRVLESVVGRLYCQRALWQRDPQRVTKFLLLTARDQFRKRMNDQGGMERTQQSRIEGDFAMCISLYHAYELLLQHGILSFYNFIKGIMDGTKGMARAKTEITKNHEFSQLMTELQEEIEPPMDQSANESVLFSQFSPRRRALMNVPKPSSTFKSHPKLMKLKEIVLEHFEKFRDKNGADSKNVATRVMIFSQYRDSVNEIAAMLAQHKPLVRVMSFIGQQSTGKSSRGLTQKEQLQVVQRFRQGGYNTLVATCVGEEGLDIGEVDLIVCFDAHASPIRLVQRMGRTGRKRDGRIVILVTEGKEEQVYQKSQRSKKSIHKAVMQAAKSFDLYSENPRMVPRQMTPSVLKMEMTVGKFQAQSKSKKKGKSSEGADIKNFTSKSATSTSKKSDGFLTYEELVYWQEHFKLPDHEAGLSPQLSVTKRSRRSLLEAKKPVTQPSLAEWLPWQNTLHPVNHVSHSRRTQHLVELLEFAELHGARDGEDESYDLEMMSFLNEEDILKAGETERNIGEEPATENNGGYGESEGAGKVAKKGKRPRKKLQMGEEVDGGKDDGRNSRKEEQEDGTSKTKNTKGAKKRSPENKARWREFLKQFDDKDTDFESDDGNLLAAGSNKNVEVDSHLQYDDDAVSKDDLEVVGEACEADVMTEADDDGIGLEQEVHQATHEANNETKSVLESDGDNISDAASDELSNLFPNITSDFHGFNTTGVTLPETRFASAVISIPTPPSLDSLDKISFLPASGELEEVNVETEDVLGELRENQDQEDDKLVTSNAVSPKGSFVCDSLKEPFLMADFLEENDFMNSEVETNEGNGLESGPSKIKDQQRSPSKTHSPETYVGYSTPIHVNEGVHEETKCQGSRISVNQNSTDNLNIVRLDNHAAKDSSEDGKNNETLIVEKEHNKRGVLRDEDLKVENCEAVEQNDFGFGVWCGSPSHEFNVCEDEGDLPQDDVVFAEAFFMDVTDDDAFTNMTLPEDDNVTRGDRCKRDVEQNVFSECDTRSGTSCEVRSLEESMAKTNLRGSKTGFENEGGKANPRDEKPKSLVAIDLQASISELSAFQRSPAADRVTSSMVKNKLSCDPDSGSRSKSKVLKEIKRSLTEEAITVSVQTLTVQDVRTRGEHSSVTALPDSGPLNLCTRDSVEAPPVSITVSPRQASRKLGLKGKQAQSYPADELPSRGEEVELPHGESEPHLAEERNGTKTVNDDGDNDGGNACDNVGEDTRTVGSNSRSNTGSNISSTMGSKNENARNNVGNDSVSISPLRKKFKLSRKRTSDTKKQSGGKAANQAKSTSNSLNLISKKGNVFCENVDGTKVNCSSRDIESRGSETSIKPPLSMDTAPNGTTVVREHPSANLSNLRTHNGAVVAVMESEDEDDDDVVRPAKKAISFRKRALSSPCPQEQFKRPADLAKQCENHTRRLPSRNLHLGSKSDEEFEVHKAGVRGKSDSAMASQMKPTAAHKRRSLETCAEQTTRKSLHSVRKKNDKNTLKNHFLDDEAELSGSDINDVSSDEAEDDGEDEMDSFIDDSTQLTQRTPSTGRPRDASSPIDMMAVYRQSLQSPLCGALNFKTPLFHKQRNKYKMVYQHRNVNEVNDSVSEAEETYGSESILENEVEVQHEDEAHTENEVSHRVGGKNTDTKSLLHIDKSFEESQIGRPVKRMKRKRILDDSYDEEGSPKLSKQRNLSEACNKENSIVANAVAPVSNRNTQLQASPQRNTVRAFGNFPVKSTESIGNLHGDFTKSSVVLASNQQINESSSSRQSAADRGGMRKSESFLEWNNDVSDSELLVAFEPECVQVPYIKKSPSTIFQDQELKEIAVAMEMTDDDVAMDINELPTFSLGFDFLSEEFFTNNGSTGKADSSKDVSATLKERETENVGTKPIAKPEANIFSERNEFPVNKKSSKEKSNWHRAEHFTKIVQHPKQSLEKPHQLMKNPQIQKKPSAGSVSHPVSHETTAAPRNATKANISNTSSTVSTHKLVSNNSLLLTTRIKNTAGIDEQRSVPSAHAKLQVVTPSCRPNPLVTRPAISPLLSSSEKDKGKTVILVDTREISSSQVVSLLRLKHNVKAEVCQLTSCDYIVSNRMAVKRKSASDVASGANSPKLVECVRRMCDLYERPCLIIEKDRVKPGETDKFIKTKAYISTLASIAQTHVKMMYSDSQEETASLLTELANIETKKGAAITAPTALIKEREQVFRVVVSIPRVSYITALNLCSSYNTLQEIINSTSSELEKRTPGLSGPRAAEIHKYLRHKFNPEMVVTKK